MRLANDAAPTETQVREALEKLLASRPFARSGRLTRFLRFTVDHALAGTGDQVKEYLVGVEVFDRKPDYDPRMDPIVRVEARRLRAKLKLYYASAGKTDAIPGHVNFVSFTASREGVYHGLCAEFCGEQHAVMRFRVVAVQPDVFQRWIQAHQAAPGAPAAGDVARLGPGDPARGQQAFLKPTNLCITCHTIAGTQAVAQVGPNLTYFGDRLTIAGGALPNTPENMASFIRHPEKHAPRTAMPDLGVTEAHARDMVAYLYTLK